MRPGDELQPGQGCYQRIQGRLSQTSRHGRRRGDARRCRGRRRPGRPPAPRRASQSCCSRKRCVSTGMPPRRTHPERRGHADDQMQLRGSGDQAIQLGRKDRRKRLPARLRRARHPLTRAFLRGCHAMIRVSPGAELRNDQPASGQSARSSLDGRSPPMLGRNFPPPNDCLRLRPGGAALLPSSA